MAMPALQQKRMERLDLYGLWMRKDAKSRGSNSTKTESSSVGSEARLSTGKKAVEGASKILVVVLVAETAHGLKDECF